MAKPEPRSQAVVRYAVGWARDYVADFAATTLFKVATTGAGVTGIGAYLLGLSVDVVILAALLVFGGTILVTEVAQKALPTRPRIDVASIRQQDIGDIRPRDRADLQAALALSLLIDNARRGEDARLVVDGMLQSATGHYTVAHDAMVWGNKDQVSMSRPPVLVQAGEARTVDLVLLMTNGEYGALLGGYSIDAHITVDLRFRDLTTGVARRVEAICAVVS